MFNKTYELIATVFGIGRIPGAPGTTASLIGMGLAVLVSGHIALYVMITVAVTALGFVASDRVEAIIGTKDPSCVVIDEVAGILIAFFLLPVTVPVLFITFFLFRAFDMFKIYPGNRFESLSGGTGIMMDDIIAGIYANLTMHAALRLAGQV